MTTITEQTFAAFHKVGHAAADHTKGLSAGARPLRCLAGVGGAGHSLNDEEGVRTPGRKGQNLKMSEPNVTQMGPPSRPKELNGEAPHKLLDAEIASALGAETRPGWTEWVLIASIGAVLWKPLSEYSAQVSVNAAWAVGLCVFLVLDALWAGRHVLDRGDPDRRDRYQRLQDLRAVSPSYAAAQAIRFVAMAFAVQKAPPEGPALIRIAAFVYPFVGLLVASLPYGGWSGDLVRERQFQARGLVLVGLGFSVAVLIGVVNGLVHARATMGDVRVGSLGAAAMYLFLLLANARRQSPMLQSLVRIRRQLALGQIELASAANATEVALLGFTVTRALQKWTTYFMDYLEREREQITRVGEHYRTVEEKVGGLGPGQSVPATEAKILQLALISVEAVIGAMEKEKRVAWDDRLSQMDEYAKKLEAHNADEYKRIREALVRSRADADELRDELKTKVKDLLARPGLVMAGEEKALRPDSLP